MIIEINDENNTRIVGTDDQTVENILQAHGYDPENTDYTVE